MYYKLSNYTFHFTEDGNNYIFSTISGALIEISEKLYSILKSEYTIKEKDLISNPVLQLLRDKKILCTEQDDKSYFNSLYVEYLNQSFQTSHLALTILPTERCNLVCPYCFEINKQQIDMSKEVQNSIINYIKKSSYASYSITWFGGEPLLRNDVIENLLEELSKLNNKKMKGHCLITNGTLLSPKVFEIFKRYPLDEIQITFDGLKERHDSLRCYKNGAGTFDKIKDGIINFANVFPKTRISFRINVDKKNQDEFKNLCEEIKGWFNDSLNVKYNIYPGIIQDKGAESCSSSCLNKFDELDFYMKIKSKGINYFHYPIRKRSGCIATSTSTAVIGSDGDIYRCWEDVGNKDYVVSNITSSVISNQNLYSDYLINGSKFNSSKCRICPFLPICSGGCPKERMKDYKESNINLCSLYRINDGILLKDIFKNIITKDIKRKEQFASE